MDHTIIHAASSLAATAMSIIINSETDITSFLAIRRQKKERELVIIQNLLIARKYVPRSLWVKAQSTGWWDFVVPRLTQSDFNSYFRMTPAILDELVKLLEPMMKKRDTHIRKCVPVKKRVAIGVYCLSSCAEIRTIAALFGVGKATAQECFDDFVIAVSAIIAPKFIKWPSTQEQFKQLADQFENLWQFPMTIAAIDGCHFPVSPPMDKATDYYNFKGWYSIVAFAACDAECRVLYLRTGLPGRANDSTIFRNSSLYREITQRNCIPQSDRVIQGVQIPYNILGDSAFRLEPWCLKPFPHKSHLSDDQIRFNQRLSRARRTVENLFGRVKGRWRRVLKRQESNVENCRIIIVSAFAMHNFCEYYRAPFDVRWADEVAEADEQHPQPDQPEDINNAPSGEAVRNALIQEFRDNRLGWGDV